MTIKTKPKPISIEEEPPHELYSRLCGLPSVASACVSAEGAFFPRPACVRQAQHLPLTASQRSVAVIRLAELDKEEEDDDEEEITSSISTKHRPNVKSDDTTTTTATTTTTQSQFTKFYQCATQNPPQLSSFALNANNCKGYAIMQRMGWREEHNHGRLGKFHQGTLEPIKTTLKFDQAGLGRSRYKSMRRRLKNGNDKTVITQEQTARVTHTQEHIVRARNSSSRGAKVAVDTDITSKANHRLPAKPKMWLEQERQRNKAVHLMLRTDVSAEYEDLYWQLHK